MPTPEEVLYTAGLFVGHPYNTFNRFYDPEEGKADEYDCSGYCTVVFRLLGIEPGPAPWTSWSIAAWCYEAGLEISVDEAIRTPGALLFAGPNRGLEGWGPTGHIAISRGDGTVFETPAWGPWGHGSGIGSAYGRGWTGGAKVPGVHTDGVAYLPPPQDPALRRGALGPAVGDWQVFLQKAGYPNELRIDGEYGPMTEDAVRWFQRLCQITEDGEVGPDTWAARRFIESLPPSSPAPEPAPVPQPVPEPPPAPTPAPIPTPEPVPGPVIPPPSIDQVLAHAATKSTWRAARKSIRHDLSLRGE